ncbi:hypothetical protein K3495_g16646, partial [Podosphaera aphanis]
MFQKAFSTAVITEKLMKKSDQEIIHARLGHPGKSRSERYHLMVDDIKPLKHCFCEVCAISKITRKIERRPLPKATAKLEVLHIDLCGPFPEKSLLGNYYMLTQTCQATGRTWLKFSPTKKDIVKKVIECFEEGEADAVRYGNSEKIKELRFDRGKEFLNSTMESYCKQKHILINPTVGYNPESNGIAERCNRSILEGADALRIEAGLAKEFWEFAADAYNYLRNRSPIKTLQSKT